ncbi:MAG TPA: LCP family protein [Acidimicrobiales bacterium]|jgi:polyisoprenyl-teichoic acid--peptidoglycan teichoic acid transferase|nr:LCP family protein [Acidimicrobiales bacterium]
MAAPQGEVVLTRHRRWPRRLLIAANIIVALCVVATAGGYAYFRIQFGRIPTIDGLKDVLAGGGDNEPSDPMNVLLVGSDTRATLEGEEKQFGTATQVGGQRADTIIVLRIEPEAKRAAMMSVPRDLYVKQAGTQRSSRINDAFQAGPDRLIQTITDNLGIPIHHYVQLDFNGFRAIVGALDGVDIYSPARARDTVSGLNIPNPGCVSLNGEQALAFVRSRHYQYFENGKWRSDPTGDLGRIERQQDFIRRVLKKANQKAKGLDVFAVNNLVNAGIKNVQIDEHFSSKDITALARRFRSLDPNAVEMFTLPTVPANVGGASVLRLKQPDASAVIDTFLAKAPPPAEGGAAKPDVPDIPPSSIRVRVLNGSGAEGQAREVSKDLGAAGFTIAGIGQADSFRYDATVIRFVPSQRDKALVVQSKIQGETELKEDPTLKAVDVVVVTGGKFAGIVGGTPQAPTTTAAPAKGAGSKPAATTTTAPPKPEPDC